MIAVMLLVAAVCAYFAIEERRARRRWREEAELDWVRRRAEALAALHRIHEEEGQT